MKDLPMGKRFLFKDFVIKTTLMSYLFAYVSKLFWKSVELMKQNFCQKWLTFYLHIYIYIYYNIANKFY